MELEEVKGIGGKKVEELKKKGIMTAEDVAIMSPEELASLLGCSWKVAKEIQADALAKTIEKVVEVHLFRETEKRIKETVQYISTGSKAFDKILNGGVKTDASTSVFGQFATAKTQLAKQLAINCLDQIPDSKVMYIETEAGTFSPTRIREMQTTSGRVPDNYDRIFHIPARTIANPMHQYLAYVRTQKMLEQGEPIRLIIIDSFTAKFRGYYQKREQLGDRSREFSRHFTMLDTLASKYNLAVFLTCQAMGIPTSDKEQLTSLGRPESVKFRVRGHKIWGGDTLTHSTTYLIALERKAKDYWKAVIIDAPDRPELEAYFSIRNEGIRDYIGKLK